MVAPLIHSVRAAKVQNRSIRARAVHPLRTSRRPVRVQSLPDPSRCVLRLEKRPARSRYPSQGSWLNAAPESATATPPSQYSRASQNGLEFAELRFPEIPEERSRNTADGSSDDR